jgi:5-methyltetrahydropteroyltriglutamate--homocysteine methyltransferase
VRTKLLLSGIHARSEKLIFATRSYDRSELSKNKLNKVFKSDTDRLINLQITSGFDFISDGMLRWDDPISPIIACMDNVVKGPYTRWFETNTFYRRPILIDDPIIKYEIVDNLFYHFSLEDRGKLFVLPGPYTLSKLSKSNGIDFERTLHRYSIALAGIVDRFRISSHSALILLEPALVYRYLTPREYLFPKIVEALNMISSKSPQSIVHTFFGDANRVRNLLARLNSQWIGIDLSVTSIKILLCLKGSKLALGIIDSMSPIVETPSLLKNYIRIIQKSKFEEVALCPNTDLRFLPRNIADKKILELKILTLK